MDTARPPTAAREPLATGRSLAPPQAAGQAAWALAGPDLLALGLVLFHRLTPEAGTVGAQQTAARPAGLTWFSTSSSRTVLSSTCSSTSWAQTFSLALSCTSFRMASSTDVMASLLSMMNVAKCWGQQSPLGIAVLVPRPRPRAGGPSPPRGSRRATASPQVEVPLFCPGGHLWGPRVCTAKT